MYSAKFLGRKYYLTGRQFLLCAIVMLSVLVSALFGLYKVNPWLIVVGAMICGSVSINGRRFALLPDKIQVIISNILIIVGLFGLVIL